MLVGTIWSSSSGSGTRAEVVYQCRRLARCGGHVIRVMWDGWVVVHKLWIECRLIMLPFLFIQLKFRERKAGTQRPFGVKPHSKSHEAQTFFALLGGCHGLTSHTGGKPSSCFVQIGKSGVNHSGSPAVVQGKRRQNQPARAGRFIVSFNAPLPC